MPIPNEEFVLKLANDWYRTLESNLAHRNHLETQARLGMVSMEAEVRETIPNSPLTYHVRIRKGQLLPDAIRRGRICGRRPDMAGLPSESGKEYKHWFEPHSGPLTRDDLYLQVKDVSLQELFRTYEDRMNSLNGAREVLVLGRTSIAARVRAHADPRSWEAGDLTLDPPLLLATDLPATGVKALGGAWRIFLRVAALRYEMAALVARHNEAPPHKGLWLAFRIDDDHLFGRFVWTDNGRSISLIARRYAKGQRASRVDEANLPDWLMRELKIPAAERKALAPHELYRRRMARIYEKCVEEIVEPLLSAGPNSIQKGEELLRRAGLPESDLAGPSSDPMPLAM